MVDGVCKLPLLEDYKSITWMCDLVPEVGGSRM